MPGTTPEADLAVGSPRTQRALLAVLLVSLVVKLAALAWAGDIQPIKDERRYVAAGASVAAGEGIHYPGRVWSDVHAPPMYAWFLGGVFRAGGGVQAAKVAQVFLSTVTLWFVFLLGRRWLDERSALLATAIFGLYPTAVAFTHYAFNETLFLFWMLPAVVLVFDRRGELSSGRSFFAAGLLFGAAALTRVALAYFVHLLPFWLLWRTRDLRSTGVRTALLLAGFWIAIAPYLVHVYRKYDGFLMISSAAAVVWHRHYNAFPPENHDWGFPPTRLARSTPELIARARPEVDETNPVLQVRAETELGLAFLRQNPGLCARRFGMRVSELLNPTSFLIRHLRMGAYEKGTDGSVIRNPLPGWVVEPVVLLTVLSYFLVAVAGVLALAGAGPGHGRSFTLFFILFVIGIHGMTVSFSRYRLQLIPFLAIWASAFVVAPGATLEYLTDTRRWVSCVLALLVLVTAWIWHIGKIW